MAAEALREYVDVCTRQHVSYVAEFVEALSTGQRECSLVDRAVSLNGVDVHCMAQALQRDHDIRTLDLEGNDIGVDGVQALIDALSNNPSLKELRLGRNKLGDTAVMVLGNSINHNGLGLRVLDLSHNDITQTGCAALFPVSASRGHSELVELSLYGNRLDGESGGTIANAIRNTVRLKHLHLGYNQLQDRGAAAIAKSLPLARGVVTIDLSGNRIGPAGGAELAAALAEPSCLLQRANLRHNDFDDATLRLFIDVVRHNCVLVQLFLGFMCPTDQSITENMLQAATSNRTLLLLDLLGWELEATRTATAVTALLNSATALRALLLEGTQSLRLTIDALNEKRSARQWQNVVYIGEDEHAGSAAVNAAQREMRQQQQQQLQQQQQQQQQHPFMREATPPRETPRKLSNAPSPNGQQNASTNAPLVLNSKPAEEPTQPMHASSPSKPHAHEPQQQPSSPAPGNTSSAAPTASAASPAAAPLLEVEAALERLRNLQTSDLQLRDAAARAAEAIYRHCCSRHHADAERLSSLEARLATLERGAPAAAPATASPTKIESTPPPPPPPAPAHSEPAGHSNTNGSTNANNSSSSAPPPRKSALESATGFVQTMANTINRRSEEEETKNNASAKPAPKAAATSGTNAPASSTQSQPASSGNATTTAPAPAASSEQGNTASNGGRRTAQPTQNSEAATATTPVQRRTAPTKDNSGETVTARELPPARAEESTAPAGRSNGEPASQQQLSPRRAPPPSAAAATPPRERNLTVGEQHSPHGPSEKLPIPVAVNERSRSPSHASVHPTEAAPGDEPRKPALQQSLISRGFLVGERDKAKADAPARPNRARMADALSGPGAVNRAASRSNAAGSTTPADA